MPAISPEWQHITLYAVGAALLILLLQRIPVVGGIIRFLFSLGLLAFFLFLLFQQAPYDPNLGRVASGFGLDRQEVVGEEIRIRMAPDGHFWAAVTINGRNMRMMIDSGATITALSEETARDVGIAPEASLVPVVLRTANGMVQARTGTVEELRIGNVTAKDLKVVISPALGGLNVIGMNFLSKLASWRVEGRTLIMTPEHRLASQPR